MCQSNAPGSLGASVFDLSEIYHKLFPIVTAWKQFMLQRQPSDSTEAESKGRLYVVATDVQNCFDRMKRDALWRYDQSGLFTDVIVKISISFFVTVSSREHSSLKNSVFSVARLRIRPLAPISKSNPRTESRPNRRNQRLVIAGNLLPTYFLFR
jgi:hypothetical protein